VQETSSEALIMMNWFPNKKRQLVESILQQNQQCVAFELEPPHLKSSDFGLLNIEKYYHLHLNSPHQANIAMFKAKAKTCVGLWTLNIPTLTSKTLKQGLNHLIKTPCSIVGLPNCYPLRFNLTPNLAFFKDKKAWVKVCWIAKNFVLKRTISVHLTLNHLLSSAIYP
jgi:hypothetical protein